jgi:hypothetical protein
MTGLLDKACNEVQGQLLTDKYATALIQGFGRSFVVMGGLQKLGIRDDEEFRDSAACFLTCGWIVAARFGRTGLRKTTRYETILSDGTSFSSLWARMLHTSSAGNILLCHIANYAPHSSIYVPHTTCHADTQIFWRTTPSLLVSERMISSCSSIISRRRPDTKWPTCVSSRHDVSQSEYDL